MIHPVNVVFANAVNYRTYRLQIRSRKHSGKIGARTAKLTKRMVTITKPYKFKDSDPVTILSFLGQLKRACASNGVSKGVVMWLFHFFMAKSPVPSLTNRMTPRKDHGDKSDGRRGIEE